MTEHNIAPDAAKRIDAAQQKYAAALRRLQELRANIAHGMPAEVRTWLDEADRHVKEAFAEWVMLVEHETGRKLKSLPQSVAAE